MNRMTAIALTLLLAIAGAAIAQPAANQNSPTRVEAARQALIEWFECEECEEGQLEALLRFRAIIVPSLRAALLEGMGPASEELLRRDLARRYDELLRYAETHPNSKPGSSREEFVEMNVSNYQARYRVRAAQALAVIGGGEAVRALEEGAKRTERRDVLREIDTALKRARANR